MHSASIPLSTSAHMLPRSSLLRRFVLLSLTLHAVVLVIASGQPLLPDITLGQSTLDVRLDAQRSRNDNHVTEHILQRTGRMPSSATQSRTTAVAASGPDETDKPAIGHEALQNYLLGALNSELARYLTYPHFARERGWQGTVVVGVGIAPDGLLYNLRLVKSSGFALLDQASLASLRMIKTLPITAAFEWGEPVEVILPIQFHLTDNS